MERLNNKVEWKSCACVKCPKYMISTEGEVFNKTSNYKMNPKLNRNRYVMICIRDNEGNRHVFNLGRLMLMVFKPHPLQNMKGLIEADYIDGNPENNRLSNLRWLSKEENRSALKHQRKKRKSQKWGIAIVRYELDANFNPKPNRVEMYARLADLEISLSVVTTLLNFGHYSKKYKCRIYYKDQLPDEFKDLPIEIKSVRNNGRERKIGCYDDKQNLIKVYDSITSVEEDGFSKFKAFNAAREKTLYRGLNWKFVD